MPNNRTWVALYDYHDADGTLLYQVARSADKDFSQRHPNPDKRSGWEWNLNGVKRVPYHLPQLLAEPTAEAFLAEGEKDVQASKRTASSRRATRVAPEVAEGVRPLLHRPHRDDRRAQRRARLRARPAGAREPRGRSQRVAGS